MFFIVIFCIVSIITISAYIIVKYLQVIRELEDLHIEITEAKISMEDCKELVSKFALEMIDKDKQIVRLKKIVEIRSLDDV